MVKPVFVAVDQECLLTCSQTAQYLFGANIVRTRQRVIRLFNSGQLSGHKEGVGDKQRYYIRASSAHFYLHGHNNRTQPIRLDEASNEPA